MAQDSYRYGEDPATHHLAESLRDDDVLTDTERLIHAELIEPHISNLNAASYIDIGAGLGRHAYALRAHCSDISLIEPDTQRLREAHARFAECEQTVTALNQFASTASLATSSADIVSCFHVIQHVSHAECAAILDLFARVLRPGGIGILCCAQQHGDAPPHVALGTNGHCEPQCLAIKAETFDLLARHSQNDMLVVRRIEPKWLNRSLSERGLNILETAGYRPEPLTKLARMFEHTIRSFPSTTQHQLARSSSQFDFTDMCVIVQKSSPGTNAQ